MTFNIQFVGTPVNDDIEIMVLEKLETLEKKFSWIIGAQVFIKKEKGTYGNGRICEIRLNIPGPNLFSSSNKDTYESAVSDAIRDLERQLIKRRDEMRAR